MKIIAPVTLHSQEGCVVTYNVDVESREPMGLVDALDRGVELPTLAELAFLRKHAYENGMKEDWRKLYEEGSRAVLSCEGFGVPADEVSKDDSKVPPVIARLSKGLEFKAMLQRHQTFIEPSEVFAPSESKRAVIPRDLVKLSGIYDGIAEWQIVGGSDPDSYLAVPVQRDDINHGLGRSCYGLGEWEFLPFALGLHEIGGTQRGAEKSDDEFTDIIGNFPKQAVLEVKRRYTE